MTHADRGKTGEKKVKDRLETLSKRIDTVNYRPPDLRGGFKREALTDFLLLRQGVLTLIEVKETEHEYRLRHEHFGTPQVARMRMWQRAGANALVLIYHSTLDKWRGLDIEFFVDRVGGSWDLRGVELKDLEEILR